MVLPGFRKLSWIRPAADHQTVTMTFFFLQGSVALGRALELLLSPSTELVFDSAYFGKWYILNNFIEIFAVISPSGHSICYITHTSIYVLLLHYLKREVTFLKALI